MRRTANSNRRIAESQTNRYTRPMSGIVALRIVVFVLGGGVVVYTLVSAIRTFVVPRSIRDKLSLLVFRIVYTGFRPWRNRRRPYAERDQAMALYAPFGLLALPAVWVALVMVGYTGIYWALGVEPLGMAFTLSGSSLLTLGFDHPPTLETTVFAFSEAAIGLVLVALLIAYLPTIYSAFSRREAAVTMLEVRAGSPPSAIEMINRYYRIHGLDHIGELWPQWEAWFTDIEETHTLFAALTFFRSPQPDRSWVTASGAVLDTAALMRSTIDIPRDPHADLCIRAGYIALRRIASFFDIEYNAQPASDDTISITRAEYDEACRQLIEQGVPLKPDRDQTWSDFIGWRVNYDRVLIALARMTMAPEAPWSSDRVRE